MSPFGKLAAYVDHPDPLTAACNRIALIVASSQPSYPLYLWWIVGGDWQVGCWTFLSTPFFAAAPLLACRHALAGRTMLPLTGIANGVLSSKAFGEASGVELFLIPCLLIAALGFRHNEKRVIGALIGVTLLAASLHSHYGTSFGVFDTVQYGRFLRLNATSVAILCALIGRQLIRARASIARP